MSVTARYNLSLDVDEVLSLNQDVGSDPTIQRTTRASGTLDANSTPAATKVWSDTRALTSGTDAIDLTSLSRGSDLSTLDMTGLKVQACIITCPDSNSELVTFEDGSSNGYTLFGDASGEVSVPPGGTVALYFPEGLPDVGSSAKAVDVSSADDDATYTIELVCG